MSQTENAQTVQDTPLTIREHLDPDKHWIGETLAPPSQTEISATVGTASSPGESPFVARADHIHKLDPLIFPQYWQAFPGAADDATTGATFVTWLVGTAVTVPTWAATAFIQVNVSGIYMITALATYYLSATITGSGFSGVDYATFSPAAISQRESTAFTATTSGSLDPGSMTVLVGARRAGGTGVMRADTLSQISGFVIFKPA